MTFNSHFSFAPLHHSTLGFETLFDEVEKMLSTTELKSNNSFPPHNIVKVDDYHYIVELAVAGYSKDEIDITVDDGHLIIKGNKEDKDKDVKYLHKGIGGRNFRREFTLADHVDVVNAGLELGMLNIHLKREIPEELQPKKIEIKDTSGITIDVEATEKASK